MLNTDIGRRLDELSLTFAPPPDRYRGTDPAGAVQVEAGGPDSTPSIRLDAHWRRIVDTRGLGAAVLAALHAANLARLAASATRAEDRPQRAPGSRPAEPSGWSPSRQATRQDMESLTRAWRDLREFTHRPAELHAVPSTIHSRGRQVAVTVHHGTLVAVDVDPSWADAARGREIERIVADTVARVQAAIAAVPGRALDGCPAVPLIRAGTQLRAAVDRDWIRFSPLHQAGRHLATATLAAVGVQALATVAVLGTPTPGLPSIFGLLLLLLVQGAIALQYASVGSIYLGDLAALARRVKK